VVPIQPQLEDGTSASLPKGPRMGTHESLIDLVSCISLKIRTPCVNLTRQVQLPLLLHHPCFPAVVDSGPRILLLSLLWALAVLEYGSLRRVLGLALRLLR